MEEAHEYANELGKQGGKNLRKILKFSIAGLSENNAHALIIGYLKQVRTPCSGKYVH